MSNFLNLAKQGYDAYEQSQSDVSKTGGEEYNDTPPQQGYTPQLDHEDVVNQAANQSGGDRGMFSTAMGYINQNQDQHHDSIDEGDVQNAHQQAYGNSNPGNLSASSMGGAAALQALKSFTSGGGGGGSQNQLISMAMSEASNLFDSAGGAASGNKQDAVNGAAMTVMKMLVQSKVSGMIGGGDSGGLMGLASKFM